MFKYILLSILIAVFLNSKIVHAQQTSDDMIEIGKPKLFDVKVNDAQVAFRYRFQQGDSGAATWNSIQDKVLLDITMKFYGDRVKINMQGMTGSGFDGSWANPGVGPQDANFPFNLRRLSLSLGVATGVEVTAGSMAPEYGAGSEDSYLDNDGYIMGYRAKAKIENGELVVTGGFVGDFKEPNVFKRFDRMDDFNFVQAVYTRAIGEVIRASVEYDHIDKGDYARAAIKIDLGQWTNLLDSVVFEDMVGMSSDQGINVFATKLTKRFAKAVAGKDLVVDARYLYRTDGIDLPIGDKVFVGQSLRFTTTIPNIYSWKKIKLGMYADFIQSLDDFDRIRAELGLALKF